MNMRGLTMFISDIRACSTKEQEEKRVMKELANIRNKFTSTQALTSYNKKKYVWKLVYIYILGYEVQFGHMQVIQLLSSQKFTEKHVGYLAASVLMRNADDMMTLIVNTIRQDLQSSNEHFQSLALCAVANLGGRELSESLAGDVQRVLVGAATAPTVRKKAALCLVRLYRTDPDVLNAQEWAQRIVDILEHPDLGVVTSVTGLLHETVRREPHAYAMCMGPVINLLARLAVHRACSADYLYYGTPSPWLQVKLLRILQYYPLPVGGVQLPKRPPFVPPTAGSALPPPPPTGNVLLDRLYELLFKITTKTEVTKSVNKNNADHAILFEAVNLIVHYGVAADPVLQHQAITLLGRFVSVREPNIRYLGLASMARLAHTAQREGLDDISRAIRQHQATVLFSLKDTDISIRKRALDLLFAMCSRENAKEIVSELFNYLAVADFLIKEEMVLKIAILAERYATDYRWYLDTVLQLITIAGDHVSDDIWHRVVQIVTNREELQRYSAEAMLRSLYPMHVHETNVKVAAYVLGEFGYLLTEEPDAGEDGVDPAMAPPKFIVTPIAMFEALHKHFWSVSTATKSIMLHSYMKLLNLYEDLEPPIAEVFEAYRDSLDPELQQRACEYLALSHLPEEKMNAVLDPMPVFPENRESSLVRRLKEKEGGAAVAEARKSGSPVAATKHSAMGMVSDGKGGESSDEDDDNNGEDDEGGEGDHAEGDGGVLLDLDTESPPPQPGHVYGNVDTSDSPNAGLYPSREKEDDDEDNDEFGPGRKKGRAAGIPPELVPQLKRWYLNALVLPRALLYEDPLIQVGVQHQYKGELGQLVVFWGNKSDSALTQCALQVAEVPFMRIRANPEAVDSNILPKTQAKLQIAVECMAPFLQPPELQVHFVAADGRSFAYGLRLPVTVFSFTEPVVMEAELFLQRWGALGAGPAVDSGREQTLAVALPPLSAEEAGSWNNRVAKLNKLVHLLHLGHCDGVDFGEGPWLGVCGAGTFKTGTVHPSTGEKSSVGYMIRFRIETNAPSCEITVRAAHPSVTAAVAAVLQQQVPTIF